MYLNQGSITLRLSIPESCRYESRSSTSHWREIWSGSMSRLQTTFFAWPHVASVVRSTALTSISHLRFKFQRSRLGLVWTSSTSLSSRRLEWESRVRSGPIGMLVSTMQGLMIGGRSQDAYHEVGRTACFSRPRFSAKTSKLQDYAEPRSCTLASKPA